MPSNADFATANDIVQRHLERSRGHKPLIMDFDNIATKLAEEIAEALQLERRWMLRIVAQLRAKGRRR